jgi:hypothetical protein
MNEDFLERLDRSRKRKTKPLTGIVEVMLVQQQLNEGVRRYFKEANQHIDGGLWLRMPEIPSSSEVLDLATSNSEADSSGGEDDGDGDRDDNESLNEVQLPINRRRGAWGSKGKHHAS